MAMFAKLFESEAYGQILAVLDTNDDGDPQLKVMVRPPDMGVCHIAIDFTTGDTWEKADKALSRLDNEGAEKMAAMLFHDASALS